MASDEATRSRPKPGAGPKSEVSEPAPRGRGLLVGVSVAAVVFLAATVAFGVLWLNARSTADSRADAARADRSERTVVLTTAQKIAVDFSSYDYRHLDADFDRVYAQLTTKFRADYRKTADSLKATLQQYQGVGTARVLNAGIRSLTRTKAVVLVFVDQTTSSKVSKTPTVDRNRAVVTLERSGGKWLASDLELP